MLGASKKRKKTVQSVTLFDYFGTSTKKTRPNCISPTEGQWRFINYEDIMMLREDEDVAAVEDIVRYEPDLVTEVPKNITKQSQDLPLLFAETDIRSSPKACSSYVSNQAILREDEWAMGDDEGVISEDEDESLVTEVYQEKYYDNSSICPLCCKSLKGLFITEIERHVNKCLDSVSLSDSPAEMEESTMLQDNSEPSSSTTKTKISCMNTAFSVLMSSRKENVAWQEAMQAENMKGTVKGRRPAPFYKVMQGMPIAVDAFRYGKIPGVTAYFLTHAHSDHYTNLSASWKNVPIYCSQTTANLIIHMLNVDHKWVRPLPMNTPTIIPDTGGVKVTLIQANHCPGSVLFLFEGPQTVNAGDSVYKSSFVGSSRIFRYLHCGDFRACPEHVLHPEVKKAKIDTVYLDTTYLDPKYCFPPQHLVISACAELAFRIVRDRLALHNSENGTSDKNGSLGAWVTSNRKGKEKALPYPVQEQVLVVIGTYTIGKERIVKAVAKALSTRVYCDPRKATILKCLSDPELHELLTDDPLKAGVHIVPLHMITSDRFDDYLARWKGRWTRAIGFRPTGWTYASSGSSDTHPSIAHILSRDQRRNFTYANLKPTRNSNQKTTLYGVPYSEHSSFFELTCFALSIDTEKIIATVNVGNSRSRAKMEKWFEKWLTERSKRLKSGEESVVSYRALDYW